MAKREIGLKLNNGEVLKLKFNDEIIDTIFGIVIGKMTKGKIKKILASGDEQMIKKSFEFFPDTVLETCEHMKLDCRAIEILYHYYTYNDSIVRMIVEQEETPKWILKNLVGHVNGHISTLAKLRIHNF